jgi:putative ATP-binding cassette transporter
MRNRDKQPVAALWERICQTLSGFASSVAGGAAKRLFALLIMSMLAINGLNVVNSYVGRDFISSVESRDMPRFMWVSLVYVMVFGICTVVAVYYRFVEERLALLWREWQTKQFLERYLAGRVYLKLAAHGGLENPDQRIAEDVRAFATSSLSIFLMTLNAVFTVVAFSGVMWSISPLLFVGAVIYGSLGTWVTISLGRRLVGLNYIQADKEAGFRSELLQVGKNAEVVAMLQRESLVRGRLFQQFSEVVANARRVIAVNRNVSFFTTGYNYLIPVIPVFVVAHLFMWGEVEFGVITQSSLAFAHLMGAFSLIVTQFQSMSSYAAVMNRIRALGDAIHGASGISDGPINRVTENGRFAYEKLTLKSPEGRPWVVDLSLSVPAGGRLLIRAENHRAARELFRATAGLGHLGEGTITMPDDNHIFYMPARANLPRETLRELMANASDGESPDTGRIGEALRAVGLQSFDGQFGGLDVEHDWSEELSLDEQMLLAVARALLASPDFVFFEHPGTVLSSSQLVGVLEALSVHGIGYVSLGRSGDDGTLFDRTLLLHEDGTWEWGEA